MNIYFVRHGESEGNLNKIHQGLKYVEEGHLITTEELMREIGSFPR